MLKSKFNQFIAMSLIIYGILMFRFYNEYQELNEIIALDAMDMQAFIAREYVLGGMRQATFAFGFLIVSAFAFKSFRRKSDAKKSNKKAVQLAQSGNYKNSSDIFSVIDP